MIIFALLFAVLLPVGLFAYGMSLSRGPHLYSDRLKEIGSPILTNEQVSRIMKEHEVKILTPKKKKIARCQKVTKKITKKL